jgi:hypothetical protein
MSSYRYVIFPRGRQPSADEVRRLQEFAGALANQFAWGVCRDDDRLAVAFDARAFDHVAASDAGFEALVRLWETHGAELAEHLKFVKDAAALKPTRSAALPMPTGSAAPKPTGSTAVAGASPEQSVVARRKDPSPDAIAAAKLASAQESVARSLLGVQRTLERYAALERLGTVLPYLLMAAAILLTAGVGVYVHRQLSATEHESRQETIERTLAEPVEPLEPVVADEVGP